MGFVNRLKVAQDAGEPMERRVAALCDALTHCHLGFHAGRQELERRFGLVLGEPVTGDVLQQASEFLLTEWRANQRGSRSR